MSERCELCGLKVMRIGNSRAITGTGCPVCYGSHDNATFDRIQSALRLLKRVESGDALVIPVINELAEQREDGE